MIKKNIIVIVLMIFTSTLYLFALGLGRVFSTFIPFLHFGIPTILIANSIIFVPLLSYGILKVDSNNNIISVLKWGALLSFLLSLMLLHTPKPSSEGWEVLIAWMINVPFLILATTTKAFWTKNMQKKFGKGVSIAGKSLHTVIYIALFYWSIFIIIMSIQLF